MERSKGRFTIGAKMYIFVTATVLFAAAGVCAFAFLINADQIDTYFKRLTTDNARNYATLADIDFIRELRAVAESDEYQAIRDEAEELDDDSLVQEYLEEKGLWERYEAERAKMITYVENMEDLEYLYIVAWGEGDATVDMYIIDADDVPFYETGYYEDREVEFTGVDYTKTIEPVINNGDWGWLCSGFEPVYDEDGNLICHIGCDVSMEEVMQERYTNLSYIIGSAIFVTAIVLIGSIIFINKSVVNPLKTITSAMKRFSPAPGADYKSAGVIDLDIRKNDEIGDIYNEIRSMQTRITDSINDMTAMKQDKERAEDEARVKDKEIGEISKEAFKDPLTGIGNKNAYVRKVEEINAMITSGGAEFAIVMMDVNGLKHVNDNYGHTSGDAYLKGACHVFCEVFKHSPVYRIGGDEFVAVLTGDDYNNRSERVDELKGVFDRTYADESVQPWERYSASVGMSEYSITDMSAEFVFRRADKQMYENKDAFKKNHNM